jgi:hypothetical protein
LVVDRQDREAVDPFHREVVVAVEAAVAVVAVAALFS